MQGSAHEQSSSVSSQGEESEGEGGVQSTAHASMDAVHSIVGDSFAVASRGGRLYCTTCHRGHKSGTHEHGCHHIRTARQVCRLQDLVVAPTLEDLSHRLTPSGDLLPDAVTQAPFDTPRRAGHAFDVGMLVDTCCMRCGVAFTDSVPDPQHARDSLLVVSRYRVDRVPAVLQRYCMQCGEGRPL